MRTTDEAGPVRPDGEKGVKILHDPVRNKGSAFTETERDLLGLRGLLPPRVSVQEAQVRRILENLRRKTSDLDRYVALVTLQDRNETLFYRVVVDNLPEVMPIIYTPTVGEACLRFGHIFRRPRGLYISARDRGRVGELLNNWPHEDVRIVVVTDGERILGLGDLGADGMGIPIGKLSLYTACAGIHPTWCLPVMLDVGTENEALLTDPLYLGLQQRRVRGQEYDELFEEFVTELRARFPGAVIQLEDFGNRNAFRLLETYRDRGCVFDDDIQGTGAVALAGLASALQLTGEQLSDHRYLFLGAGQAGLGIAETIVAALVDQGLSDSEARTHCWFIDSRGLVVEGREGLSNGKRRFAHRHEEMSDLTEIVTSIRPAALIGVAGVSGAFSQETVEAFGKIRERPIIFALSNPTSKAECTAEQAYTWTGGRAIFASGSPFEPVDYQGRRFVPGQGNNAYIFPGVGLGLIAAKSSRATDEMFLAAASALADHVTDEDLATGRVYPDLSRIREVSVRVAEAVVRVAIDQGHAGAGVPDDMETHIRSLMFDPVYELQS
jgi:malate dehydrogenase (oxaloacetate-decarboxylating)(NADP+)